MTRRNRRSIAVVMVAIAAIALGFVAGRVNGQVQIVSEPTREPTLAPPHQCICTVDDGVCTCDVCDCKPATKAVQASVVKSHQVSSSISKLLPSRVGGPGAPITLPPDPDDINNHPGMIDFQRQHANLNSDRPAAVTQATNSVSPGAVASQPPAYTPPPIERDHMVLDCSGGSCRWVPAGSVTQQAQPQQFRRRGLFGKR